MSIVKQFNTAMGHPAPPVPPLHPDKNVLRLSLRLIDEEHREVRAELVNLLNYTPAVSSVFEAYARLLKELADLRYVVEHCAVQLGLPIEDAYREVHRSNMSKLGDDGRPIYNEYGKVQKGPNYAPPNMAQFIPDILDQ